MRRDNTDLIIAAAVTAAAAAVLLVTGIIAAAGPAVAVLRALAGLPLVLVLPGYALSTLLLPAGSALPGHVNRVLWHCIWVTGLSLAVTVLGGLALNLTPAGLTRASWAISLTVLTMVALAASACLRAWRSRAGTAREVRARRPARSPSIASYSIASYSIVRYRIVRYKVAYLVAALAVTGAAIGLAQVSAGWQRTPGSAQLWLVPARNSTAAGQATLGVRSAYRQAEDFHLVLRRGTRTVGTWTFTLASGQTWQQTVTAAVGQQLAAELTAAGQHTAAQTVHLTSS
jgi:hypothetical protein